MKQKAQDSITAAWAFFNQQKLIKFLFTYIFSLLSRLEIIGLKKARIP